MSWFSNLLVLSCAEIGEFDPNPCQLLLHISWYPRKQPAHTPHSDAPHAVCLASLAGSLSMAHCSHTNTVNALAMAPAATASLTSPPAHLGTFLWGESHLKHTQWWSHRANTKRGSYRDV